MRALWGFAVIAAASVAAGAPSGHTQEGYQQIKHPMVACQHWETYDRLVKYNVNHDDEGFRNLYVLAMAQGECTHFRIGETVFVVERGFISVKLRRKGGILEYWTETIVVQP